MRTRESVYWALFWVAVAVALGLFLLGALGLAEAATGTALVALGLALWIEWQRRR